MIDEQDTFAIRRKMKLDVANLVAQSAAGHAVKTTVSCRNDLLKFSAVEHPMSNGFATALHLQPICIGMLIDH